MPSSAHVITGWRLSRTYFIARALDSQLIQSQCQSQSQSQSYFATGGLPLCREVGLLSYEQAWPLSSVSACY
jgi:hypothetical protein